MTALTRQQIQLGWIDVDLSQVIVICTLQLDDDDPIPLSCHHALTSALYANGNMGRHWKAEGGKADQASGFARWCLYIEGIAVTLFVTYQDRRYPTSYEISHSQYESGKTGRSDRLLEIVRQQRQRRYDLNGVPFSEEIDVQATYTEGAIHQVTVNAYERNAKARKACIEHYGKCCHICKFDFGAVYGAVGDGVIHVHHLKQLCEIGDSYKVSPIDDLRPVCPNCHAIIHRFSHPYSIEAVKEMLQLTMKSAPFS